MNKLLSLALSLALCVPAVAQRAPSPKIDQTITAGDVKMSLNYTSISYGEGTTVTALLSKEGGEMRAMMNERAASRPMATFTTSVAVKCGDVALAAGEYQVYFTVGDDLVVSMHFKQGEKDVATKLKLDNGTHESKRLLMCLYAEETGAGVYLSFGKMTGMVSFVPAKKDEKKEEKK